jgi:hypothetical protein
MISLVRTALATLAVAAVSVSVAVAPASASAAPQSSAAPIAAKSAKGWPRSMDRAFLAGCGHTSLCRHALHWLERHYSLGQVARHAGDQRWINHVSREALNAIL